MMAKTRWLAAAVLFTILTPACSDNHKSKPGADRKMVVSSTGKFSQGYQDGQRDAKWSLTDLSGADMWLWMTEKEYQDGYHQGWKDGRAVSKLETQAKENTLKEPRPTREVGGIQP